MQRTHLFAVVLLAAMGLGPGVLSAAVTRECPVPKATPESYTWNFQREASQLLQRVQLDARLVKRHAATLESEARDPYVNWRTDGELLTRMRDRIDDMGSVACRLQTIRRVVTPAQKQAIDQSLPLLALLATTTDHTIARLNQNHMNLWKPDYQHDTQDLYTTAAELNHTLAARG
jgi:hypothetical protein